MRHFIPLTQLFYHVSFILKTQVYYYVPSLYVFLYVYKVKSAASC